MSEFDPELNVSRNSIIQKIQERLVLENNQNRLISLVGSAGIGKSWLMADLYLQLVEKDGFVPLWLSLSSGTHYPGTNINVPDCSQANGRSAWLQVVVGFVNQSCGREIIHFDKTLPFTTMFDLLGKAICRHANNCQPVLFVDGFDDIQDSSELDFWQEQVLATFWSTTCTLTLLARRDVQTINHPLLSWNEDRILLPAFSTEQSQRQIEKRERRFLEEPANPTTLTEILSRYTTGNPYINTHLFDKVIEREIPNVTLEDLEDCIDSFMHRANLDTSTKPLVKRLAEELEPEWTGRDLRQISPTIKIEDSGMKLLFGAGIIQQIPDTPFYVIDKGLYALVRRAAQMEANHG